MNKIAEEFLLETLRIIQNILEATDMVDEEDIELLENEIERFAGELVE